MGNELMVPMGVLQKLRSGFVARTGDLIVRQARAGTTRAPLMPTLTLLGSVLVDCVVVSRAPARVGPDGEVRDPAVHARMSYAMDELTTALEYMSAKRSVIPL